MPKRKKKPQTHEFEPRSTLLLEGTTWEKVSIYLIPGQKERLDFIAKKIMKFRAKFFITRNQKERITANALIRALIENFLKLEDSLQMESVCSEKDLYKWIEKLFRLN